MADNNKRIRLDLELDDKGFRDKIKSLIDEVSRGNDKLSGQSPSYTSGLSSADRARYERERFQQASSKFYNQYDAKSIEQARENVSKKGAFARQEDRYVVETANQIEKLNKTLQETTSTEKASEYEQKSRHREYRTMSTKQLEVEKERLKADVKKSDKAGDLTTADARRADLAAVTGALRDRNGGESSQMQFMRQTATNAFIGQALSGFNNLAGPNANAAMGSMQSGFSAYSASRAAGGSRLEAAMTGGLDALIGFAIKSTVKSLIVEDERNKLRSQLSEGEITAGNALSTPGIFGPDGKLTSKFSRVGLDPEQALEQQQKLLRETGYGKNLAQRTLEEQYLQKGMGLDSGDLQAFNRYENTGGFGAAEGTLVFTALLQKLDTGINIGDEHGVGKDLARLPKYLEKLLQVSEMNLKITGENNKEQQKSTMEFFGSIVGMGGIFKNEQNAADLYAGIQSGFANPTDELHRYKNIRAVRSVMGNASDTEIALQMENMKDPRVVNSLINQYRSDFGENRNTNAGRLRYLQGLQSILGTNSLAKTVEFDTQYDKTGGLRQQDVDKLMQGKGDPMERLATSAETLTSAFTTFEAAVGDYMTKFGEGVVEFGKQVVEFGKSIGEFVETVKNLPDAIGSSIGNYLGFGDDKPATNTVRSGTVNNPSNFPWKPPVVAKK